MSSVARDRARQAEPPMVLNGSANRRLPLRVLFVHRDVGDVGQCVQELKKGHFKVSADVVLTPEQFAVRLKAKYYDVVLAEYPSPELAGEARTGNVASSGNGKFPASSSLIRRNRRRWRSSSAVAPPTASAWITLGTCRWLSVEPSVRIIFAKSAIEPKKGCAIQRHATVLW